MDRHFLEELGKRRTFGIISHPDAGKTTLTEKLLMFGGAWWAFDEKIHQGGFWRPRSQEEIVCYIERPVGTDVKLASETMKLFEAELLPLPEGVTMRATAWGNRAFLRIEFEDETLHSAYPELFRNNLIVVLAALALVAVGVIRLRGGWIF